MNKKYGISVLVCIIILGAVLTFIHANNTGSPNHVQTSQQSNASTNSNIVNSPVAGKHYSVGINETINLKTR